jgi:hypothetical protein
MRSLAPAVHLRAALSRRGIGSILVLLAAVLTACAAEPEPGVPVERVGVPAGHYHHVLRFPDGQLLIGADREPSYATRAARFYHLQKERFIDVPLPDDARCTRRTEYTAAKALPDGNLGFSMICRGFWPERPVGQDDARFVVAYDWELSAIQQIVAAPLPVTTWSPSWNPEMTRGVVGIGSLLGTVAWITPLGMEPMIVSIETGEQSWSLADNLAAMEDYRRGNDRTSEVGIARNPAWSPDGRLVAFWASTDVIGRTGMARARGSYGLFLLDVETWQLTSIVENVQNVTLLRWSPDSQWLAFFGDIGSSKHSLWAVSVDGAGLEYVDRGSGFDFHPGFNGWDWLSEEEIIATRCLDSECEETEVLKYFVGEIVGATQ